MLAVSPLGAFAQETPPASAEDSITAASVRILAIIAIGGAAVVGLALAKVGWMVAARWIGRLGGKG
jgi:hypothetical protein